MEIGIVGKPNVGKSTLFNALTLADVPVANYPFTTINAHVGVGYVRVKCVCQEFGVKDTPVTSYCVNGFRFIPVKVIDTAGLVPDAWKGRGLGNRFLDKISKADILVHVIDASGSTDKEGRPVKPGTNDPLEDIKFLERELVFWIRGIIMKEWKRIIKVVEHFKRDPAEEIYNQLSGLKFKLDSIREGIQLITEKFGSIIRWGDDALNEFISLLMKLDKPIIIAANKIDLPYAEENIERIKELGYDVVPISAISEYVLKKLSVKGIVKYLPGDPDFEILRRDSLTSEQINALNIIKNKIFRRYGGTNVQRLINHAVFEVLSYIVVYPVRNPSKLSDGQGRVLPDAILLPKGSRLRDLAYLIHSQLGERMAFGIDVRTGARLKADYILKNNDVISIVVA